MENTPSSFNKQSAAAWIQSQLTRLNMTLSGEIEEPHARPWSTVWRVPTTNGDLYFKATPSVLVYEPALTQTIGRQHPDQIPAVLAADWGQGWMLLPDGGQRLREILRSEGSSQRWETILPQYAALQITHINQLDPLLALGMPDRRLDKLPALLENLLADTGMLYIDEPDGITTAEYETLQGFLPRFSELCAELASYGIPHTINHGDLHDGNIFVKDGRYDASFGRYIIFDWGDCSAAHPFFSLRTTFASLENSLNLAEDDPIFEHLAHIYLQSWTDYAPMDNLLAAFGLARRLWALSSMLVWYRIVSSLEPSERGAYAVPVPALLQELLEANSLR